MGVDRPSRPALSDRRALLAGLTLLAAYVVVAITYGNFAMPTGVDYIALREAMREIGVDQRLIRDLAPHVAASAVAKLVLLAPACLLLAWPLGRRWPRRWLDRGTPAARPALVAITLATAGLLVLWSQAVLQGYPVYDDEFTYLFQAQTLASGWIAAPLPPCPPCFENIFIILRDGVWAGKYSSGHPLLLAASLLVGSPYVVTILLAALTPWLVYLIGRETEQPPTALLAAALLVISPMFIVTASTLMNHGTCLFFLALFTLGYLRSGRRWAWALVAGAALGMAFNIRPQSAVAVGAPFAVWTLVRVRVEGRAALGRGALVVVGMVPLLVWAGVYNHAVTGDWLRFPFMLLEKPAPSAGEFLAFTGQTDPTHTLWRGLFYDLLNLWRLNLHLFGWGASLVFVGVALWRGPLGAHDRAWLGAAAVTLAIYAGFLSPGVLELSPRYLYPLLIPLVLWSARGIRAAHALATAGGRPRGLVPAFVVLSAVLAAATLGWEQARHLHAVTSSVARPYRAIEEAGLRDAIVLVRAKPPSGWVFGLRNNHPDLERNETIAVKLTGLRDVLALWDAFPERRLYVLAFDPEDPAAEPDLVPYTRAELQRLRGGE